MVRRSISDQELRRDLAFEVHYLVYASVRFREITGKDKAVFQDSSLMHARNLLEFTNPTRPRGGGWWIQEMGGGKPSADPNFRNWLGLINAKVTHLGRGRVVRPPWPVAEDDERLVTLSAYVLQRVLDALPAGKRGPHNVAMRSVAKAGLKYLKQPTRSNLASLARLVDK